MRKEATILFFWIVLAVVLVLSQSEVQAQQPTPSDDDVNAVARELYCPVCENIPLDVCPTQACAQWRDLIRQKLALGWDKEQIKQYFVDTYGDRVLPEPPRRGLHWLVYIVPPVVILAGGYVLVRAMRRQKKTITMAPPPAPEQDEYLRRVDEELKNSRR
jgi:cytochrome c-type biogenesis protein CcmH